MPTVNLNDAIFQVISLHTFSNVWYWLSVAVAWSTASHWIIGAPFDLIYRARRFGGVAAEDLDALVAINVRRLNEIAEIAGLWLVGLIAFVLTGLAMAGFYYGFEMAQGMFCLGFPLTLTAIMTVKLSRAFAIKQPTGAALASALFRLRFRIQVLALVSIFITAVYGMYSTLSSPL